MSIRQFLRRCRFAKVDPGVVHGDEWSGMKELRGCDSRVIGWVRHNKAT